MKGASMGEMKHTAEPWRVEEIGNRRAFLTIAKEDDSILTVVDECGNSFGAVYKRDDALRIVACVNACSGISQDILEDPEYLIKKELESIDELFNLRKKAESELNEMRARLAALEDIATAVEADIDCGRPLEYNVEELRAELIRARCSLGILPDQEITREEEIESKR